MLAAIGVKDTMELYADVPDSIRLHRPLALGEPLSEREVAAYFKKLAAANANLQEYACFLGAGAYDHFIPSTVGHGKKPARMFLLNIWSQLIKHIKFNGLAYK